MSDNSKRNASFKFPIGGVPVQFPFENPYGAQKQMMSKIVNALKKRENALLESPTGSGKSLALLCSVLAWLKKAKEEADVKTAAKRKELTILEEEIGDLRRQILRQQQSPDNQKAKRKSGYFEPGVQNLLNNLDAKLRRAKEMRDAINAERKKLVPKLYYGTRTHRQIAQIVKELGRTDYSDVRMTILGSRTQYCVNRRAQDCGTGVNDGCNALLSGKDITKRGEVVDGKQGKKCNCVFRENMRELNDDGNAKEKTLPKKIGYR